MYGNNGKCWGLSRWIRGLVPLIGSAGRSMAIGRKPNASQKIVRTFVFVDECLLGCWPKVGRIIGNLCVWESYLDYLSFRL